MVAYNKKVMDHFIAPRNVGEIKGADGIGIIGNPVSVAILFQIILINVQIIIYFASFFIFW